MNVAIIGCGGMGRLHAEMATNCGLRVTACADAMRKAAMSAAAPYRAKVFADPQGAIKSKEVDIVVITTPTPTHEKYVTAAANAGKHIFCEKPFGRSADECKRAIAVAKRAEVKLFVGHVVRYFHEFEAIKRQIDAGAIGETGWVKLYRGGIFPGGPKSWFRDYAQSGGVTFDCMIHDLDWARYVFGDPERIFCQTLMRKTPVQVDYSQVTMRMKNGVIATIIGTWAQPSGFQVKVEVCGSSGMVQYDSHDAPLSGEARKVVSGPSMIVPVSPVAVSPYQREWEEFLGLIEGRGEPRVTAQDALHAVQMAEAALQSAEKRQPVKL